MEDALDVGVGGVVFEVVLGEEGEVEVDALLLDHLQAASLDLEGKDVLVIIFFVLLIHLLVQVLEIARFFVISILDCLFDRLLVLLCHLLAHLHGRQRFIRDTHLADDATISNTSKKMSEIIKCTP